MKDRGGGKKEGLICPKRPEAQPSPAAAGSEPQPPSFSSLTPPSLQCFTTCGGRSTKVKRKETSSPQNKEAYSCDPPPPQNTPVHHQPAGETRPPEDHRAPQKSTDSSQGRGAAGTQPPPDGGSPRTQGRQPPGTRPPTHTRTQRPGVPERPGVTGTPPPPNLGGQRIILLPLSKRDQRKLRNVQRQVGDSVRGN